MAETVCCRGDCSETLPRLRRLGGWARLALVLIAFWLPGSGAAQDRPAAAPLDKPVLTGTVLAPVQSLRPSPRTARLPATRWHRRPEAALWTRAMLSALAGHAAPLVNEVPRDIAEWCPAYPHNPPRQRAAFWAGFASALAFHESTWNPRAVGGGGLWYGLLQILPATARHYDCRAGSGAALTRGSANLSCALRIMARTVPRDGAIALRDTRWRGVAADWGPMRSPGKRKDMADWLRAQSYCRPLEVTRPRLRPAPWPPARGS